MLRIRSVVRYAVWIAIVASAAQAALASDADKAQQSSWQRQERCDIPGHDIKGFSTKGPDECQAACEAHATCQGYTFVTGWGRCQLKSNTKRRFDVRMLSAQVNHVDGKKHLPSPKEDHDHKGKDLEASPRQLSNADACAQACLTTAGCEGYVYIDGYSACWLKRSAGELRPKIFICGYRTPSD